MANFSRRPWRPCCAIGGATRAPRKLQQVPGANFGSVSGTDTPDGGIELLLARKPPQSGVFIVNSLSTPTFQSCSRMFGSCWCGVVTFDIRDGIGQRLATGLSSRTIIRINEISQKHFSIPVSQSRAIAKDGPALLTLAVALPNHLTSLRYIPPCATHV